MSFQIEGIVTKLENKMQIAVYALRQTKQTLLYNWHFVDTGRNTISNVIRS